MIFLLSILAKATVVIALALFVARCSRRAPASMRHLTLAAGFAVVAALPLAEFTVPTLTVPIARPRPDLALGPILRIDTATTAPPSAASPAAPARAGTTRAQAPSAVALLIAGWIIGAVCCLVPVLLTPWRLRRLRRSSRPWPPGNALVLALAPNAGRRKTAVFVNDDVTAPLTCGIVRPAIVLPAEAPLWSADDVRQALVHELEHVRRADWLVHVASRVVCAVYWFHPLAWIAWRQLSLEAERACDDAVLGVAERTAYAQQLVTLARRHMTAPPIPVLSMVDRSDLSTRVAAVLDDTQARGRLGLARTTAIVAAAVLLAATVAPLRAAQNPAPGQPASVPAFDVVSIKENRSGEQGQRSQRQPGRIVMTNFPIRQMIVNFFGLQPQQLVGGPDWIDTARYDITAAMSGEVPVTEPGTVGPVQLMMQRVLAERFTLVVHTETRELPVYALTLARGDGRLGPGIKKAAVDCETVMNGMLKSARAGGPPPEAPRQSDGSPACGMTFGPDNRLRAGGTSMARLAQNLSRSAGRIVVDRTGLAGAFDFAVEFTGDGPAPGGSLAGDANLPSLFTALEEQLGLKLQPQRGPVEVLVIDRVERPIEN